MLDKPDALLFRNHVYAFVSKSAGIHFIKCFQVQQVFQFTKQLENHCASREHGVDARGRTRGCHNMKLKDCMFHIRMAGDLERIQKAPTSGIVSEVGKALERLQRERIIPKGDIPRDSIMATYLKLRMTEPGSNQKLLKTLWSDGDQRLSAYLAIVVRLWLLSPAESVVESMASAVKAVFGTQQARGLNHESAEHELIIRWNGPNVPHADWLIKAVLRKHPHLDNFVRASFSEQVQGRVIARHKRERCARSFIYRD